MVLDLAEDGRAQLTLIDVGCMRRIHGPMGPWRDILGISLILAVVSLRHGETFGMFEGCFQSLVRAREVSCAEIRRRIQPFLDK